MEHSDATSQPTSNFELGGLTCDTGQAVADEPRPRRLVSLPAVPQLLQAIRHGSLAILGQALFAGSHFVVNVALARWLPPVEYGIFTLAYAVFLLFSMLYCACIYEPILVYGAGRHAGRFRDYINLVLRMNLVLLV